MQVQTFLGEVDCAKFQSQFGCRVVNSIVAWLIIFVQLSVLGTAFVVLASAGNSIYSDKGYTSLGFILVGMATLVVATVLPYFFTVKTFFADTEKADDPVDKFVTTLALILGLILLLFQLKVLLVIVVPDHWYNQKAWIRRFLVSGTAKKEARTKKASRFKITAMVNHAFNMHDMPLSKSSARLTTGPRGNACGDAMLAFDSTINDREEIGGILWTFQNMWNGKIFDEEGVWLHARLIASNLSQLFVALFFLILGPYVIWVATRPADELPPTVSPAPTPDPVVVQANAILPVVDYLLGLLAEAPGEVTDLVWSSTDPVATAQFTGRILDAVSNSTIADALGSLSPSALSAVVFWGSQILQDDEDEDTFTNRRRRRRLEDASTEEDEDEDFIEFITPELWQ